MVGTYALFKKHTEILLPEIGKSYDDLMNFEAYLNNLAKKKPVTSAGKPIEKILSEHKEIVDSLRNIENALSGSHESLEDLDNLIVQEFVHIKGKIHPFLLNFFKGTPRHLAILESNLSVPEGKKDDNNSAQSKSDIIRSGELHAQTVDYIYAYIGFLSMFRNICMYIKSGTTRNSKTSIWKL